MTRIQTMSFTGTTDSNGDLEITKMLDSDMMVGKAMVFQDGKFETVEFFNLYVYTRKKEGLGVTGGEGDGGGMGGWGGSLFLSPPTLAGTIFKKSDELVIKIEAGVDNAAKLFHVLLPYQVIP